MLISFCYFCCGLGIDDAGLDENLTEVAVICALKHLEGVTIARCYCDNQRLETGWGFVLQDRVFATPIVDPAPAPKKGIAEIVNSLVG